MLNEDINEATGLFEVLSLMPVVESFSFCDQLRKNTSGMASAQLEFSHWQLIDEVINGRFLGWVSFLDGCSS